jgi:predicted cupin superfamily sugar epimerase
LSDLPSDPEAAAIARELGLQRHPEGGWYREIVREPAVGGRSARTSIHFLLCAGERSHWHRVDVLETWIWRDGSVLELRIGDKRRVVRIGPGHADKADVPVGDWQSAVTTGAWTLVQCDCVPGFDFAGFELAPPGWEP